MKNTVTKQDSNLRTLQTKFGEITINLNNVITFDKGLPGLPQYKKYCIAACPVEKFKNFVLLQSTEEDQLIFMLYPLDVESQTFIESKDIDEGCKQADIKRQNLALLLVACPKVIDDKKVLTANVKAPIFLDSEAKIAMQVIFQTDKYNVQHVL